MVAINLVIGDAIIAISYRLLVFKIVGMRYEV